MQDIVRELSNNEKILRHRWIQQQLETRITQLVNKPELGVQESDNHYVPAISGGITMLAGRQLIVPIKNGISALPADPSVLEWLLKGDDVFPLRSYGHVIDHANAVETEPTIFPCRSRQMHRNLGVFLNFKQFVSFTTLVWGLVGMRLLQQDDVRWLTQHHVAPTGLTVMREDKKRIITAMMGHYDKIQYRLLPQDGHYPLMLCFGNVNQPLVLGDTTDIGAKISINVFYLHLHPQFLSQEVAKVRAAIPPNAAALFRKEDVPEEEGVAGWLRFIVKAHNIHHGKSAPLPQPTPAAMQEEAGEAEEETMEQADAETIPQPSMPEDDETEAEADTEVPASDRRKSERLTREQKFNLLPNVLEGVDAFDVLIRMKEGGGYFEKAFTGTPMVVDRLIGEAGEKLPKERDEEAARQTRGTPENSTAKPLIEVVKGNLVFANKAIFMAVQQRRYAARAMLKAVKGLDKLDWFLPDIQVLAPHEFGQVPGFVAGQYRQNRDRLCSVMITYDPALWDLPLRERKMLIADSKGPKIWVFPRQWMIDLPSGYTWKDAGWFGTPKDPSILDFVIPNGNYDI